MSIEFLEDGAVNLGIRITYLVKIIPARLGEDSVALGAASVVIKDVLVQA